MSDEKPSPDPSDQTDDVLARQYNEIAALAGGLAHEIKNPLSTIRLNMDLLAEDLAEMQGPGQRRAQGKVEVVRQECLRLQGLLDDFLRFTRVHHPRLQATDLNRLVHRVLEFFRPQAEEAGVEIVEYLDPDLPRVTLDPDAFYGAILNLVLNAQQSMPGGGQLMVRTGLCQRGVALDLIDTGRGMDEETLSRMFDVFFSTKDGGSGLGLPTTRRVVEAHRGRISVESEPGRGTHFRIELPTPPRLTEAVGGEEGRKEGGKEGGKERGREGGKE